ncbi:putative 2OG-Fe(II) oxygenase [Nodularia spumigena CS-591/04]|uniref:putative 2OG-Fe(II) oxygenase n=1 Tax=Cyanophyceae TaxID=3028117 RepID=UPI00232DF8C6|nr:MULTISPECIES: putative 2OG-Fe(II) oxygenase [Cyanophyceae]MDB9323318.1 putative 2OG-Fe(II) oxygenase [Nodularia spumigena CS-591/07A]MDB9330722.1 putative 2OG-Fe(II) oxygenase [Nodularia spumigena CS-591/04]MDB9360557.1 putative 2OG-Fe(II) oxygenase [Nodularia spumigena CS-588/02]MDB9363989.1 putative 2OG-Fe(II) oxygenase [Nodularia spumigena CS-588/02A10]MDB9398994.1 putative 2OG-Fe(II) oxygenase [Microcystis aeruginosa CS-567/02-A1]
MKKILLEFATPIYISKYEKSEQFQDLLRNMAIGEADLAGQKGNIVRGQELLNKNPYLQLNSLETKPDPLSIGRSVKSETFDDFHLKSELVRPFFIWCLDSFRYFVENISGTQFQNYIVPTIQNCWASIYRAGDYHQYHSHPMSAFAGAYCVEAPSAEAPQGAIDFIDPRPNMNYYLPHMPLFANDTKSVILKPGELVIFPAWLKHFVNPFKTEGVRITISINFDFVDLQSSEKSI